VQRPIGEWLRAGFVPVRGLRLPAAEQAQPASLLQPEGIYGPSFLTTKNYFVIKEYNFSDLYVLFVGHLSDRILDGRPFASSADEGRPVPGTAAVPFDYVAGTSRVTPALDEAVASMRAGERRTLIAQGALGYGRSGFTAREKPGERRFVIPPNTTLVYEIEVVAIKQP
jgi:hypothetical protein